MEKTTSNKRLTHDDITLNIIRYLNITDFDVIGKMTVWEYSMLMEGMRLQKIDEMENLHLLAYKTAVAKNKKKQGDKIVPEFPTFYDFYDKKLIETGVSSKSLDVDESEIEMYKLLSKI
ncbi:hypothetical protein [Candidatus Enterococcus ikei]|uniref:Phage protein n=1 Tax=Candidatus Enterococcus ikei TaxID=2815326 RepID=A0ABS3GUP3_9ENTE|nr:hypothetical protein [Enterococcus sp. DIV0869a]MBO0438971.1 hypothetical protein [Enterococcus sp. DIV0869a]